MMQEVPCDDTNGESTFEFVEGKIEGLTLSDDSAAALATTTAPATSVAFTDSSLHLTQPISTFSSESIDPISSTLPAPVAGPTPLPSFTQNFHPTSTETTSSYPSPISFPPGVEANKGWPAAGDNFPPPNEPPRQFYAPGTPFGIRTTSPSVISNPSPNPYSLASKPQHGYAYPSPMSADIRPPQPMAASMIQPMVPQPVSSVNSPTGIPVDPVVQPPQVQSFYNQNPQMVPIYPPAQTGATSVAVPFGDYDYGSQQQVVHPYAEGGSSHSLFGWLKESMPGGEFFSKVAEKAKSSMDTMITTLDPQMKQYIYSGGDIDLVVTSPEEDINVMGMREAFQIIFGRASVRGIDSPCTLAPQLVGFSAAFKAAEERIHHLRRGNLIHEHQPVVAVESFLAEFMPDKWYDLSCLILQDPSRHILLTAYTQPTPVSAEVVQKLQEQTPADYPLRWAGLAMNIGSVLNYSFQGTHTEWHEAASGIHMKDMIFLAAKTLAVQYKRSLYGSGSS